MMQAAPNSYSRRWFDFFHAPIDEARTAQEVAFVSRCAPLPDFRRVADVCCGMGRHARALSARGYSVVGVDRDAHAIAKARELGGESTYLQTDVREYSPEPDSLDLAIIMSQSFGHFDAATNLRVLSQLSDGIRRGGRIILDLWSKDFFAAHQGEREFNTAGGVVREAKRVDENRLFVHLHYPDGGEDRFEWQLFSPADMDVFARSAGLRVTFSCTDFTSTTRSSASKPRIQFLFEAK